MPSSNSSLSGALPLVRALILHARQVPDDRLLLMADVTPPDDCVSDYSRLIRQERSQLDYALNTGFYNGGIFYDVFTLVHFEPPEFFNSGMIVTSISYHTRMRYSTPDWGNARRPTHYEYMAWKADSGQGIPDQLEAIIDSFLVRKAHEGASFFGRSKRKILTNDRIELPINTLYGVPCAIYWADGSMRVNGGDGEMLYGVLVSAPRAETPGASTIAAEKRCQARLESFIANDSKPTKTKANCREELCHEFHTSGRAFNRAVTSRVVV
jgi:hypothetical protein